MRNTIKISDCRIELLKAFARRREQRYSLGTKPVVSLPEAAALELRPSQSTQAMN